MPSGDDLQPGKRYRPTEQSLDLAERIAQAQGRAFDREATRKLAGNLYAVMFADLVRVLELEIEPVRFHAGVYRMAHAFAASSRDGNAAVALNMVFDHWVFSLTHLVGICTFTVPDHQTQQRIAADTAHLFEMLSYSGHFETSRTRMAYYLLHPAYNTQLLNLTALLARAMIVFVLCHELAHIILGHLSVEDTSPELELEADAKAAEYFLRVVAYGRTDRDTHIHVDPKMASGPVILSMMFELYEAWLAAKGIRLEQTSRHPPAAQRTAQLQGLMTSEFNREAVDIAVGATHAIQGLAELLNLPEL